jgi:hypothetical protein
MVPSGDSQPSAMDPTPMRHHKNSAMPLRPSEYHSGSPVAIRRLPKRLWGDEHPLTECMAFGVEGFPFSQTGGLLKRYRRADDRDPNAVRSLTRSEAPSPLDGEARLSLVVPDRSKFSRALESCPPKRSVSFERPDRPMIRSGTPQASFRVELRSEYRGPDYYCRHDRARAAWPFKRQPWH